MVWQTDIDSESQTERQFRESIHATGVSLCRGVQISHLVDTEHQRSAAEWESVMQQNAARGAAIEKEQLEKEPAFKQAYFSTEVNAHMCRLFLIQKPEAASEIARFHQICLLNGF